RKDKHADGWGGERHHAPTAHHRPDASETAAPRRFLCDQWGSAEKPPPPMQVARMVAEFDRVGDAAWLQPQPLLLRYAHDHGMVGFEHQYRAVEQMLIARQRDCDFGAALRHRSKAMPGNIGGGDGQQIDRALMFQFVNS